MNYNGIFRVILIYEQIDLSFSPYSYGPLDFTLDIQHQTYLEAVYLEV